MAWDGAQSGFNEQRLANNQSNLSNLAQLKTLSDVGAGMDELAAKRAQREREAQFRTEFQKLGADAKDEDILRLAHTSGLISPKDLMTSLQTAQSKKAQVDATKEATRSRLSFQMQQADMNYQFKMKNATTAEERAAETARHNHVKEALNQEAIRQTGAKIYDETGQITGGYQPGVPSAPQIPPPPGIQPPPGQPAPPPNGRIGAPVRGLTSSLPTAQLPGADNLGMWSGMPSGTPEEFAAKRAALLQIGKGPLTSSAAPGAPAQAPAPVSAPQAMPGASLPVSAPQGAAPPPGVASNMDHIDRQGTPSGMANMAAPAAPPAIPAGPAIPAPAAPVPLARSALPMPPPGLSPKEGRKWLADQAKTAEPGTLTPEGQKVAEDLIRAGKPLPKTRRGMRDDEMLNAMGAHVEAGAPSVSSSQADYRANSGALSAITKDITALKPYKEMLDLNGDVAIKLGQNIMRTNSALANKTLNWVKQIAGDNPDTAEYLAQMRILTTESARVLSNPRLVGQLSDSARHEMESVINGNMPIESTERVIRRIQQDGGFRVEKMEKEAATLRATLSGKQPVAAPPAASTGSAPFHIKGDDDYNALPKGALFIGPDGKTRQK